MDHNFSVNNASGAGAASRPHFRGETLRRIYRVWLFRKLAPVLAAEVVVISLLLYGFSKLIFVERVLQNGLNVFFQNPPGIFPFAVSAFFHAPAGTKIVIAGLGAVAALLIRLITQGILRFILVKENYFSRVGQ